MATQDTVKTLKAALTDKLHIDEKSAHISVKLDRDAIVIEGQVEGIAQKKRALYTAMGLRGVAGIVDRLLVRPSAHMSDAEIKQHLLDAIAQEPTLSGCGIRAEVLGGVVDLEGTVGSLTHKRLAGVLAWWVPGSADVINSLEVSPAEDDTDDEITDAVKIVFEKDKLVDGAVISVATKECVVTLGGAVKSEAEKNAAEDDAWYVWGVNEVVNNIVVK